MMLRIIAVFIFLSSCYGQCPEFNSGSHLTKNGMGYSSYIDPAFGIFLTGLSEHDFMDISKPILIAGAGYGAGVFQLLSSGAKYIYLNDMDNNNLYCAQEFVKSSIPEKLNNIRLLPGDINSKKIISSIPNNSLGLIYAKNLIHFFDSDKINTFFSTADHKLDKNGYFIISFENQFQDEITNMSRNIRNKFINYKNNNSTDYVSMWNIIENEYLSTSFGVNEEHCSIEQYKKTSTNIKMDGLPCMIHRGNFHFNLLIPIYVELLLMKNGFDIVDNIKINDYTTMIIALKH